MYIPLQYNRSVIEKSKEHVENSYSFKRIEHADLFFELSNRQLEKIQGDFILEYCLCIAIAEAYEADTVIIPIDIEYLKQQTTSINTYLKCLKILASIGTLKKINVLFPGFDEHFCEEIDKDYLGDLLSRPIIKSTLNIYSGGLDCTVASAYLESEKIPQHYIFYDYGQNNIKEEKFCIEKQCLSRKINSLNMIMDSELKSFFEHIKFSTGLLSNKKITLKNKEDEYVPFRNSLFLAYALNFSNTAKLDITHIITGSHMDDINSPDNNYEYYNIWNNLLKLNKNNNDIRILPILFKFGGKKEVVKLGYELNVDFSQTWTCHNQSLYGDKLVQCGNCNDCKVRERAFEDNNLVDPLLEAGRISDSDMKYIDLIVELINKIKKKDASENVSVNKTLEEMGFDSLMAIHLVTLLEDVLDIEIDGEYLIDFSSKNLIEINCLVNKVKLEHE